jgi:hypothetical protein
MDELTKISNKYGCDKSDRKHKYTVRYDSYFGDYKHKKFNMLELGFGRGKSVKMWLEYFTKSTLYMIDKRKSLPEDKLIHQYIKSGRFIYISANQIDRKVILEKLGDVPFYMIIDDASHIAEDQQYTMSFLFPLLISAGWYIIEDLKCKRSHNDSFGVNADKTLKVLENYNANGHFKSRILTPKQHRPFKEIASVRIYNKIAFIKKSA